MFDNAPVSRRNHCFHCNDEVSARIREVHWAETPSHRGLCCDCFDLSFGMELDKINVERAKRGRDPILVPYPPPMDFERFAKTVSTYIATEGNQRKLATVFEVSVRTPGAWAKGGATRPHPRLARQILDFIGESG